MIQLNGERNWLYASVDPETNELPHIQLNPTRNNALASAFFYELREKHAVDDAVILIDSAPTLKVASDRHRFGLRYERHGNRNSVERIF